MKVPCQNLFKHTMSHRAPQVQGETSRGCRRVWPCCSYSASCIEVLHSEDSFLARWPRLFGPTSVSLSPEVKRSQNSKSIRSTTQFTDRLLDIACLDFRPEEGEWLVIIAYHTSAAAWSQASLLARHVQILPASCRVLLSSIPVSKNTADTKGKCTATLLEDSDQPLPLPCPRTAHDGRTSIAQVLHALALVMARPTLNTDTDLFPAPALHRLVIVRVSLAQDIKSRFTHLMPPLPMPR